MKPMMERRAMSFVGLTKPIQQAMSVCGITLAASKTVCAHHSTKKLNADLHVSYRNSVFFSGNLLHLQEMQKTVCALFKQK